MANYDLLNDKQKEAVFHTEGPLLILAGAGSGKTRTIIHRIAYLIDEKHVSPWNILAITFTNKAAGEMRERVDSLIGGDAGAVWVSTFHSLCARILRKHGDMLGYTPSFTIYDSDDQRTLMRQIIKQLNLDPKMYRERAILAEISAAKDELKGPNTYYKEVAGDFRRMKIAECYQIYQDELMKNDAMDFDDLIIRTIQLLQAFPEVLSYYQERFKYMMVDEYQDTNTAQFELVRTIADKYKNLCVVGDDDQSIYAFRGANIRNILDFEKEYKGAKTVRLEQNYRSTKNILAAANAVIAHNRGRKDKALWTNHEQGDQVTFCEYQSAQAEASSVTQGIRDLRANGVDLSEIAVLYRTNAQSRLLEEACIRENIPYKLIGGVNFYSRAEVKDVLAYLKTIESGRDDIAVKRIINVPKRAIGKTTIDRITAFAANENMNFMTACRMADHVPELGKAAGKVIAFTQVIDKLHDEGLGIEALTRRLLDETGYMSELKAENTIEANTRIENLEEFISKAADYEQKAGDEATLAGFLEEVSLVAEIDNLEDGAPRATLMTLHSSKGLEFDHVFLTGLEDGLFPSFQSINDVEGDGVEEERRLCYVGITRARKSCALSSAKQRMVNGETRVNRPSRFVDEIPGTILNDITPEEEERTSFGRSWDGGYESGGRFKEPRRSPFSFGSSVGYDGEKGYGYGGYGGNPGSTSYQGFGGEGASGGYKKSRYASSGYSSGNRGGSSRSTSSYGSTGYGSLGYGAAGKSSAGAVSAGGGSKKKPDYEVGDFVTHKKFGDGKVIVLTEQKRDWEVTVDFENFGIKKMFAGFAKLEKL